MAYGVIDRADVSRRENLLPMGLSEFAVLKQDVDQDTPITYDMVDFCEDNIALQLRKKMEDEYQRKEPLTTER